MAAAIGRRPTAPSTSTGIQSHLLSPRQVSADRRTVYEIVFARPGARRFARGAAPVQAALRQVPGIEALLAGGPAFYGDIQAVSESDLRRSELISLPARGAGARCSSSAPSWPPACRSSSAARRSSSRWPLIFLLASVTPMSIFVLNLATLLGLGLGVDYSLLMTSRFREELARAGGGRRPDGSTDRTVVDAAIVATVGTAGRAVFFSGLTVLLGLIGLVLFEFMILRSVGIAGAIVVGLAVARRADAAAGGAGDPRAAARRAARAPRRVPLRRTRRSPQRRWARLARRVMRRPVAVFVPDARASCSCSARRSCTSASTRPTPRSCRPTCPRGRPSTSSRASSARASSRRSSLAIRTNGPATDPANVAAALRLLAPPRRGPAGHAASTASSTSTRA